jgi:hypothetical protein
MDLRLATGNDDGPLTPVAPVAPRPAAPQPIAPQPVALASVRAA